MATKKKVVQSSLPNLPNTPEPVTTADSYSYAIIEHMKYIEGLLKELVSKGE